MKSHSPTRTLGGRKMRLAAASIAVGSLILSTLAIAPSAQAVTPSAPANQSADWLRSELTNGLLHNKQYNFDDVALTIDAGFGLAAVGAYPVVLDELTAAVALNIETYVQSDEYDFNPPYDFVQVGHYAGSLAKAAAFAQVVGEDPTNFGGVDLITDLEARVASASPIAGRIMDDSFYGDNTNVVGQGFAAEALLGAGSASATSALTFLLKQQCVEGYFRLSFTASKSASNQTCDGGDPATTSAPDTDATALAVLSLQRSGDTRPAVVNAIADANAWLLSTQNADGSWGGGASTEASNSNSTALAGAALGASGAVDAVAAAEKAAIWVRRLMAFDSSPCGSALTGDEGAVAYDQAGHSAGRTEGITDLSSDQWRRATAQALPVLQFAPTNPAAPVITGPTAYVEGKTDVSLKVTGLEVGERVCVYGKGFARSRTANSATEIVVVRMPGKTKNQRYRVVSSGSQKSTVVEVLGEAELVVKLDKRVVKKGGKQSVVAKGLAEGERVRLKMDGNVVAKGFASRKGKFKATFKVRGAKGRTSLVVKGQFANRTGSARFGVR